MDQKLGAVEMNSTLAKALFEKETLYLNSERLLAIREWVINELSYPLIDITFHHSARIPFRLKCYCEKWNGEPIYFTLHTVDGSDLIKVPRGTNVINHGNHPLTGKPFICTQGSFDYHSHPGHRTDLWSNYKNKPNNDIGGLITQVWDAWGKTHD
ncbi:MAG: hypothetical protein ACTHMD_09635 [Flavisolibacter sp.]